MAKQASPGGNSLGIGIVAIIGLAILLIAGSAVGVTLLEGGRLVEDTALDELEQSHQVLTTLRQQRYQLLRYIARLFSTDEVLTSYLAEAAQEGDLVSVLDSIEEYQNLLNFDLAVVLDRNGRVLTRTDDHDAAGEDLSTIPLVSVALEDRDNRAFGVWRAEDQLYYAAAVPLVRQFDLVGYVIVAFTINDSMAIQVQRMSGSEALFLSSGPTGPAVSASSNLPSARIDATIAALRVSGDALDQAMNRGQRQDRVELTIDGESWLAFLAPLEDAAGAPVGASVTLTAIDEKRSAFRRILVAVGGAGALALALGLGLGLMLARRTTKPLGILAHAAEQAARGNLETTVPEVGQGEVRRMAESLAQILASMREKINLELFVGHVMRYLPEPAKSGGVTKPESTQLSLVAVDMRRFANPKIGYDPDENLGRLARDIQRISTSAASQKGRIVSVYGHRVMVLFEGENSVFRGLCAATEICVQLSQRENVFDEPDPPVVALTGGPVVTGSVIWGDHPSPAVAGLPVQQLDALMREAAPGEIYMSKPIYDVLAPLFQRAGVQARGQNSKLGQQTLILINPEHAAQATGVAPSTEGSTYAEERRSLADVVPGTVLGNRFDVLAQLGAGRSGLVIKARDRELGDLVTLKMLKGEVVADANRFETLKGVIRISRGILHSNILQVLDFGEADGIPFISLEFVRAMTLEYLLGKTRQVPWMASLRLGRQICFGLIGGHQHNLLHLGLKPQNVLILPAGGVKLMDFGLSAPAQADADGTACYLAPEQLEGRAGDARADLFSWGVLMYLMLTGQPPWAGGTIAEVRNNLTMSDPTPPSSSVEVPPELEQIVLRCLAKAPEERPATALALLEELEQLRF